MDNKFGNSDAVSAESPFVANDSIDLLHERGNLDFSATDNSENKYLAPLFIDYGTSSYSTLAPMAVSEIDAPISADSNYERTELLAATDLREAAESIFDNIDTNSDGFLTKDELAASVENDAFKGQEAQAVTVLYQDTSMYESLSHDRFLFDNGITRNDMIEFDRRVMAYQESRTPLSDAHRFLSSSKLQIVDLDRDTYLSLEEIRAAVDNEQLDVNVRSSMTFLENNFGEIGSIHGEQSLFFGEQKIGLDDVVKRLRQNFEVSNMVSYAELQMERTQEMQQPGIVRELFADAQHPERSVTPDAIRQGMTGDCYLLAAVAAVALTDPQSIVEMIKDNQDGTYTVTFPGNAEHPITVEAPTDSEIGLFNGGSSTGVWSNVLEKAYGKYLRTTYGAKGLTDIEGAGNGGYPHIALTMLTGREFSRDPIQEYSEKEIIGLLTNYFSSEPVRPVAVYTPDRKEDDDYYTVDGFPRQHAYTVIGIKPDAHGEMMITIRNPWGGQADTTSGTIDVTVEQFKNNFESVTVERSKGEKWQRV